MLEIILLVAHHLVLPHALLVRPKPAVAHHQRHLPIVQNF